MKYGRLDSTDTELIEDVYNILTRFEAEYPSIFGWYFNKVVPNLNKDREILVCVDKGRLVGLSIIKHSEKKLCTLFVEERQRGLGIGTKLIELSCKTLGESKPFVTVNNMYLDYYLTLFFKRNFKLVKTYRDYYAKNRVEYSFNGKLIR